MVGKTLLQSRVVARTGLSRSASPAGREMTRVRKFTGYTLTLLEKYCKNGSDTALQRLDVDDHKARIDYSEL